MSMPRGSTGFSSASPYDTKRRDSSLFWWTVVITVLLGVAVLCWMFSIYVFAHPEKPLNYKLLTHLEKLEPPKSFSALSVPSGQFYQPKEIYGKYLGYEDRHLAEANGHLKRQYITNFKQESPVYVSGRFEISQVRRLGEDDVFTSGMVVRGRSHDYPNMVIEYLFPLAEGSGDPAELFAVGDDLVLDRTSTFASLLHVAKLPEEKICFTLVPLVYGTYEAAGAASLTLSPPARLNLDGAWPITGESDPSASHPSAEETRVTVARAPEA